MRARRTIQAPHDTQIYLENATPPCSWRDGPVDAERGGGGGGGGAEEGGDAQDAGGSLAMETASSGAVP